MQLQAEYEQLRPAGKKIKFADLDRSSAGSAGHCSRRPRRTLVPRHQTNHPRTWCAPMPAPGDTVTSSPSLLPRTARRRLPQLDASRADDKLPAGAVADRSPRTYSIRPRPQMTVLVGGLRALGITAATSHGVLTDRPGVLSNDFFVDLLSAGATWKASQDQENVFESVTVGQCGEVDRHRGRPDVRVQLGLRALAEVYASADASAKFATDFVAAWTKVMELDRYVRCSSRSCINALRLRRDQRQAQRGVLVVVLHDRVVGGAVGGEQLAPLLELVAHPLDHPCRCPSSAASCSSASQRGLGRSSSRRAGVPRRRTLSWGSRAKRTIAGQAERLQQCQHDHPAGDDDDQVAVGERRAGVQLARHGQCRGQGHRAAEAGPR